jgi:hypothetical protein
VAVAAGDFELTMTELRVVSRYAVEAAERVLPLFESLYPEDVRPRAAIDAAWTFADGAPRSNRQRRAAAAAHRAARDAAGGAAEHAARAAGDAAAAAFLHPLANPTQVGHILRAAAGAARAAELAAGDDPAVGDQQIEWARQQATPALIDVLRRYPPAPGGRSRVAQLMARLDTQLRTFPPPAGPRAG